MSYRPTVATSTLHVCRYGPHPGDTFHNWRELVLHEAAGHPEIHTRIPCPAEGCTKHYAQLKYLITHYNIHSGKLTHCPTCHKGYTDPSRASRCRQSHDRHFRCPLRLCDYSNARADLVKQHCKKKHPELGDLSTSQLDSEPHTPSSETNCQPSSVPDVSFMFQAAGPDNAPFRVPEEGGPAPQLSRPALAQAAEARRIQNIMELRSQHITVSGLTPEMFDVTVPDYPFRDLRQLSSQYVQGANDDLGTSSEAGYSSPSASRRGSSESTTGSVGLYTSPAHEVSLWGGSQPSPVGSHLSMSPHPSTPTSATLPMHLSYPTQGPSPMQQNTTVPLHHPAYQGHNNTFLFGSPTQHLWSPSQATFTAEPATTSPTDYFGHAGFRSNSTGNATMHSTSPNYTYNTYHGHAHPHHRRDFSA